MPISREAARLYPKDWAVRRRFIIEYRSGGRCEWCGAVNYMPNPDTGSKVVLTIAHVWDKRPPSASLLNLAALCQRCHLNWDREGQQRQAAAESCNSYPSGRPIAPAAVG